MSLKRINKGKDNNITYIRFFIHTKELNPQQFLFHFDE